MARIPFIDGPQVRQAPLPVGAVTVDPGSVGAGLADGLASAAKTLAAVADREREKHDAAAVLSYDNQAGEWIRDSWARVSKARGKDALGITDRTLSDFDRLVGANAKSVPPRIRDAYQRVMQGRRNELAATLTRHESAEGNALADGEFAAAVDNAVADAGQFPTQPEVVAAAQAKGRGAIMARASAFGWSAEERASKLATFDRAFHGAVIDSLIGAEDNERAAAYFAAHRAELGRDADKYAAGMKTLGLRARAQKNEDTIAASFPDDFARQLESARRIENPELRDAVIARLSARRNEDETARRDAESKTLDAAESAFKAKWSTRSIPSAVWSKLDPNRQQAFRDLEKRGRDADPVLTADAAAAWYAWKQSSPTERMRTNLFADFYGKVPRSTFAAMAEEQQTLRDASRGFKANGLPIDTTDPKFTELDSADEQLRTAARRNGVLPWAKEPSGDQARDFAILHDRFRVELRAFENAQLKGARKATHDERQAIVDRLLLDVKTPGAVFGNLWPDRSKAFRVNAPEAPAAVPAAPVSDELRAEIVREYRARGVEPSEADIQRIASRYREMIP